MAENINGGTPLSSGGHQWTWGDPGIVRKEVGSAALVGAYAMNVSIGARRGRIAGKDGAPGLLTATGASRALADAALNAIEAVIETLMAAGDEYSWEDDQGHSGTALQIVAFDRQGPRHYNTAGALYTVWQYYTLDVEREVRSEEHTSELQSLS